jgi:hypothetical protein
MEKLSLKQLISIQGGRNEGLCGALQAQADAFARDGATDAQWDTWDDNYAKYC